jgi:hypothetical protein
MSINMENLHQIVADSMKNNQIPGAAVAVIWIMKLFYLKGTEKRLLRNGARQSVRIHCFVLHQ